MRTSARAQRAPFAPRKSRINESSTLWGLLCPGENGSRLAVYRTAPSTTNVPQQSGMTQSPEWRKNGRNMEDGWNIRSGRADLDCHPSLGPLPHFPSSSCHTGKKAMACAGLSCSGWENAMHHPGSLEKPQTCHRWVTASVEQPCKDHSPHAGCRRLQSPLLNHLLHSTSFMGPCSLSAKYLRSGPVQRGRRPLTRSCPSSFPTHPLLQAGTPSAFHKGQKKYGSWMCDCKLSRCLAHPRGGPARKDLICSSNLGKINPPQVSSQMWYCLPVFTLTGAGNVRGPCVSQTGVPQHSPHRQVGRWGRPKPLSVSSYSREIWHKGLWSSNSCLQRIGRRPQTFHLAWHGSTLHGQAMAEKGKN